MIILPAIDIKDKTCVRLVKGDFATVHKVAEDPLITAASFKKAGSVWLHMVDLDGAVLGERANAEVFTEVAKNSGLKVELGGGIRDLKTIEYYLNKGISRVILGSAAVSNPEMTAEAVKEFGEHIAVGIDAMNRMVATRGWLDTSEVDFVEMGKRMEDIGVKYIIFTDIDCDGMLSGPNLEQLIKLNDAVSCNITASGGIKDIQNIIDLKKANMYGAICGRSIYSGTLNLAEAIKECE